MSQLQSTRRVFVGSAAAAVPLRAAAPGPNDTIRMAAIGTGGMGRYNLTVFSKFKDVAIPLICDVNQLHAREANEKILGGKAEIVGDYRRVLERKDIDAVIIATPDHWHAIPTIHACQAGKDVYCEKPMTYCVAEGRRMVQAARKYNRIVQVDTQQRSGPHYAEAAELVRTGKIGKVTHVRCWNIGNRWPGIGFPADEPAPATMDWDFWLGPARKVPYSAVKASGSFRHFWDFAGGTLTDWGTHHIASVHHILGQDRPAAVCSMGGKWAIQDLLETPDTLHVMWEYAGFTLEFELKEANGYAADRNGYGIVFYGTDGTLFIDRSGFELVPEKDRAYPRVVGQPRSGGPIGTSLNVYHARNFLDCVRSRKLPNADVEFGHRATTVTHLGNISLRTGRKLKWDPVNETIPDDAEAARMLIRAEYRKPYVLPEV